MNTAIKRITYISPYFWPEEIGSAPYCTEFAVFLAEQGHAVRVLSTRPFYPKPDDFVAWSDGHRDQEKFGSVDLSRAPFNPASSAGFKNRLRNDVRFAWHVIRGAFSLKERKTDHVIVYVPSIIGALAAWIFALTHKATFSIVVHDIESGLAKALGLMSRGAAIRVLMTLERFVLNRADSIAVLTEGMKSELHDLGCRTSIDVVPIWSKSLVYRAPSTSSVVTLGYSGNFGRKQNLDQLVPILHQLKAQGALMQILLRGEGSEKERLKSLIAELQIPDVRFEGLVPQEKLAEALQDIDLHLVPQASGVANYALPSKLITLMAAGRAFVAIAEAGSALDQMARESGGGLCFPPEAEPEIVSAILAILRDPERLADMGRSGRDYVTTRMSREQLLPALAGALGIGMARHPSSSP